MEKVTTARNEIGPLLDQLIYELDAEGYATQKAYFSRIRGLFQEASSELELSTSIVELSAGPAIGFQMPTTANVLMSRILEKVASLTRDLEGATPNIH